MLRVSLPCGDGRWREIPSTSEKRCPTERAVAAARSVCISSCRMHRRFYTGKRASLSRTTWRATALSAIMFAVRARWSRQQMRAKDWDGGETIVQRCKISCTLGACRHNIPLCRDFPPEIRCLPSTQLRSYAQRFEVELRMCQTKHLLQRCAVHLRAHVCSNCMPDFRRAHAINSSPRSFRPTTASVAHNVLQKACRDSRIPAPLSPTIPESRS
jgi:hypothetical protein